MAAPWSNSWQRWYTLPGLHRVLVNNRDLTPVGHVGGCILLMLVSKALSTSLSLGLRISSTCILGVCLGVW